MSRSDVDPDSTAALGKVAIEAGKLGYGCLTMTGWIALILGAGAVVAGVFAAMGY